MVLRELDLTQIIIRIAIAMVVGGLIGLDRTLKNRPAGIRTHMLVCIGSALVMITNQYVYQAFESGDPVRLGAQVVSGIGFLGAGTILTAHNHKITGLTTAASLWASAAVGLALGIGFYEGAIVGSIAIIIAVTVLQVIDDKLDRKRQAFDLYFELKEGYDLADLMTTLQSRGYQLERIRLEGDTSKQKNVDAFVAKLRSREFMDADHIQMMMLGLDEIRYCEIML